METQKHRTPHVYFHAITCEVTDVKPGASGPQAQSSPRNQRYREEAVPVIVNFQALILVRR